jgi:hypothetical protein
MIHAGLDAWWGVYRDVENPLPGLALTAALEALAKYRATAPSIDDTAFAKAEIMMAAYDARWAPTMHEWEVVGVELEFVTTVPGRKRLRVAGKIDKLLRRRSDGAIWFVEHKTTGADLSAGSTYWQRLRIDPQVSIYFGGCRELGHEPVGCLYDVIDRPAQKLLKATPIEARKYTKATAKEPSRLYANQREADETVQEFRGRLGEMITAEPAAYFARVEVVRLESEIAESALDVETTALQIRDSATSEHSPRNPNACFMYNRACEFLSACDGTASLDDETKFTRVANVHQELTSVA